MEKAAREQLHVLLDRVIDASLEVEWAFFRLHRFSNYRQEIEIAIAGVEASERRPESEFTKAVFRVSAATKE